MRRIVLMLAAMGACLALSAGAAMAQATTETVNFSERGSLATSNPCSAGGEILLEGRIHLVFHLTRDDNGGLHIVVRDNQQWVGTDLATGTRYVMASHNNGVVNQHEFFSPNGATEFTLQSKFQLVSRGPGENFLITQVVHGTVTPNGEVTAQVDKVEASCSG